MYHFSVGCNDVKKSDILNTHKFCNDEEKYKIIFGLIKPVFILLLSSSESYATKYMSLNNEKCMVRPTLIELNPVKLNYFPFMITLDKCSASYKYVGDLYTNICFPSKTKDVNVKVFNMITNKNEGKIMIKHISCHCKYKFNSKTSNSTKKWINETCQC